MGRFWNPLPLFDVCVCQRAHVKDLERWNLEGNWIDHLFVALIHYAPRCLTELLPKLVGGKAEQCCLAKKGFSAVFMLFF